MSGLNASFKEQQSQFGFCPADSSRWADLERLFGERGACGGCWCMAWRLEKREYEAGKGAANKERLKALTTLQVPPGVLAYRGDEPVGWCAVAPRAEYAALRRSRVLKPLDDTPVWSISCLFVRRDHRRAGLSTGLLLAAAEFAKRHGAVVVEGYPVRPSSQNMPGPFLWTGALNSFTRAGFVEAGRHSDARPIMRKVLAE